MRLQETAKENPTLHDVAILVILSDLGYPIPDSRTASLRILTIYSIL